MDRTLRSILWILVALVVLSSVSTGWFFVAKEKLYNDYVKLENLFKANMEKLNLEIASMNKENSELKQKMEAVQNQLKLLEVDKNNLKYEYEAIVDERDYLKRQLASAKKGKVFIETKLKDLESGMFVSGLLKEKASIEVELDKLKNSLGPRDLETERLKNENTDLNARISRLQDEKNSVEQKLRDSTQVAEILSRDILRESEKNKLNIQDVERAKTESAVLKTKVAEFENMAKEYNILLAEKADARVKIAKLAGDLENKNQELNSLKTTIAYRPDNEKEFRAEAYHTPEEVDLPPIVLNQESTKVAKLTTPSLERISESSGLKGRVVTVNKDHNFVVIDLGKQDGINIGNVFNVYRGETLLGSIEVIQTRERIAAADIKNIKEGLSVEINDVVVKR